ncbi:hypothetical protein SOM41_20670 [Enterobacter sp. CFBP8995]|nr:hypothetical protein [Enterobacter sp. CFBP8995]
MLFLLLGAGYLIDPMLAHYLRRFAGNYLNSVGMRCETVGLAMSEKRTLWFSANGSIFESHLDSIWNISLK